MPLGHDYSEAELIAAVDLWQARTQPKKPDVAAEKEITLLARHITPTVLRGGVVPDPDAPSSPEPEPSPVGPRLEVDFAKRQKWKDRHGIFARTNERAPEYKLPPNVKVIRSFRTEKRSGSHVTLFRGTGLKTNEEYPRRTIDKLFGSKARTKTKETSKRGRRNSRMTDLSFGTDSVRTRKVMLSLLHLLSIARYNVTY